MQIHINKNELKFFLKMDGVRFFFICLIKVQIIIFLTLMSTFTVFATTSKWQLSPSSYAKSINLHASPFILKRPLRIGMIEDAPQPFSIKISEGKYWEGITPDTLSIITHALSLKTDVIKFKSRQSAILALSKGEIDLLGGENHNIPLMSPLETSYPYVSCTPLLVGKRNNFHPYTVPISGQVGVVRHTIDPEAIILNNPQVKITEYESVETMFRALLNNEVEWIVGDMVTVMYHLKLADYAEYSPRLPSSLPTISYRFVFSPNMSDLKKSFDNVLSNITTNQKLGLLRFWGWSEIEQPSKPQLTNQENAWIKLQHPIINVLINETFPPYSYIDQQGTYQGISADVLYEIGNRTGLRFKITPSSNLSDLNKTFSTEDFHMVTTATLTNLYKDDALYTRPYVTGLIALVGKKGNVLHFDNLQSTKLSVASPALRKILEKKFPSAHLIQAKNSLQALTMVMEGESDAAVTYLLTANYLISHYFLGDLEHLDILPNFIGSISFAINKKYPNAKILQSVLNKGIIDLGVGYGAELSLQWRELDADEKSVWSEHITRSKYIVVLSASMLFPLLFLIIHLYRQRIRRGAELEYWRSRGDLFDGIPQPIVVRNNNAEFIQCNNSFLSLFNTTSEQVIGVSTRDFTGVSYRLALQNEKHFLALLQSGNGEVRDIKIKIHGERFYFREWSVPFTRDKKIAGFITGWIDMTDIKRMAHELSVAHDKALQESKIKSHFLAVMSHEIRTPLNAIIGGLELTLNKFSHHGVWSHEAINAAYSSSQHLSSLIGNILDIAKIEAGKLILTPRPIHINNFLITQLKVFDSLAKQKKIGLTLYPLLSPHSYFLVDENSLKQIIYNLLGNAIKFTQEGEVTISVYATEKQFIRFEIRDTGCGISLEQQSSLFSPFFQADIHYNNDKTGTGLGLAICKQLCDYMGGDIVVNSALGKGTLVSVKIPMPECIGDDYDDALTSLGTDPQPYQHRSLNILIVDDHSANLWILNQQLQFLGHKAIIATQGEEAYSIYNESKVDVIITDCNMPIMNGYELTKKIRNLEQENNIAPIPIIGFTANAQIEERQACLALGMTACIFKPIDIKELSKCLATLYCADDSLDNHVVD
ncbi:ATP-binding protein [Aeromonas sp. 600724]|uniref:ATP-binding protein n=1 Tax=Aeromonas sp. 600724 TaxID=2712031 RepID=UPI003BA20B20